MPALIALPDKGCYPRSAIIGVEAGSIFAACSISTTASASRFVANTPPENSRISLVPLALSPVKRPESTTREKSLGSSRIHLETGDIVFSWQDPSGNTHGALKKGSAYFIFDYPKGSNTGSEGINDSSLLVGHHTPAGKSLAQPYKGTE
jgi:hypothetical protein